jgi:hypothetical protein
MNKGLRSSNCHRLELANQAWIHNDLHLVKYTRAAFDMGSFDPEYTRLCLAGAA